MQPQLKILHIEPTTSCNLRCFHCAIRRLSYRHDIMDWETFKPLIDVAKKYRPLVILNGHGECLTHPDYLLMFDAMAYAGCDIEFQTNATLLPLYLCNSFMATGRWKRLTVSVDGIGEEYEAIRHVPWSLTLQHLQQFCSARGSNEVPALALEFVAMKRNIASLPRVAQLAVDLRANTLLISDLIEYDKTVGQGLRGKDLYDAQPYFHAAREILAKSGINIGMEVSDEVCRAFGWDNGRFSRIEARQDEQPPCCVPWVAAYVRANGDVFPCCRLCDSIPPVGNIKRQSVEDIWNGQEWSEFRDLMMAGRWPLACSECTRVEKVK